MNKPTPQQMDLIPTENALPMPTGTDTMSMIERLARDPSFDADKLEKLLLMKERQDKEEARKAFNKALQGFQNVCPALRKTKAGIKTDAGVVVNRYLPLDQMLIMVRPVMQQFGLSHRFETDVARNVVRCYAMHEMGHEEYSEFPFEKVPGKVTNACQQYGVGQSYAMRYAFKAVFGIVEQGDDTDAVLLAQKVTEPQYKALADLYDNIPEQQRKVFDAWMEKRGFGKLADLPASGYDSVHSMLKRVFDGVAK